MDQCPFCGEPVKFLLYVETKDSDIYECVNHGQIIKVRDTGRIYLPK